MANNYFAKQNPTDIAIQSEDGGGLVFTQQGKYIFGSKLPDVNQQLNEEAFQGNVDVDPNTNSSYIGIMNAQSEPINIDIPSTNQYSLFTPPENIIIEPNPTEEECDPEFDAVLIGGLDDVSKGYKPLKEQLSIFKEGYGTNKNVKSFSHSTSVDTITNFLIDHPNAPVIMFSAGCKYADKIADVPGINKKRIYIVEPYAASSNVVNIVQSAVRKGVPEKNVFVGKTTGTGQGVVSNPSKTNSTKRGIDAHWDALKIVGQTMSEVIKCNAQQPQQTDPNISPTPTPTPTPTPPTSMTIQEMEEGIYNANFLPASDNPGADLFDSDYGDTCQVANDNVKEDEPKKDISDTVVLDTVINPTERDKYIRFSDKALEDYNNGVINPNTIIDLIAIGKATNIKIYIGTARKGHSCKTTSGNVSRHMKGYGLDLPAFYDLNGVINNGKFTAASGATKPENTPADFKALADRFVASAITLSGASRGEAGKKRGVLWYFNDPKKGGNHFNHVHYSNNDDYPGWSKKIIPKSFNCKCEDIKKQGGGLRYEGCN